MVNQDQAGPDPWEGEMFRILVNNVQDYALFVMDSHGHVLRWTPAAQKLLGYQEEEILGQSAEVIFTREDNRIGTLAREIAHALATGGAQDERWYVRKDGSRFWSSGAVTPLRDKAGGLRGFAKIMRERTEQQHQVEQEQLAAFGRDIGLALSRNDTLRGTLSQCAQAMVRHLHGAFARIWTLNEKQQMLELQASAGLYTHLNGHHARIPLGQWKIGLIAAEKQPHLTNTVLGDPRISNQEWAKQEGMVAFAGYPLIAEGQVVGVMAMFARQPLSPDLLEAMALMGSSIALAIQRKRLEESLRRQADLLDLAPVWARALDDCITLWSQGAEQLYGWTKEEAVGRISHELLQTRFPKPRRDIQADLLAQGQWEGELIRLKRDGTTVVVASRWLLHTTGVGQPEAILEVNNDITERKQAEREARFLAEASAALASLVDYESTLQNVARLAVPFFADWCAVDMLQPDGSLRRLAIAHADQAKTQLAQELQQRYPSDVRLPCGAYQVVRTGQSELVEEILDARLVEVAQDQDHLRILRELGLKSYLCVPLRVRGKNLGAITFVGGESGRRFDTTTLRVAEDLAHRAAVAVENARLYQQVREADRRKDEFLAMLAHELRNPLAPIQNALQIMRMPGVETSIAGKARDMAERQMHHLTRLVDDLLDVSRVVRGKVQLRPEVVELQSVVTRALETAQPVVQAYRHEVTVSLPSEPLWLKADPVRLAQVIANLLNNAAKYTEQGGHIWLAAGMEGTDVVLRVRDNGIGIPAEMLPRIFEMFVQVDRSIGRSQGGLGIGLTLAKSLVEMHGGGVEAHSDGPGQGSEFVVRLPFSSSRRRDEEKILKAGGGQPTPPSRHILVVDDNRDAAESLAILLGLLRQDVRVAYDGRTALEEARANPPELAFIDIGMPRMDGYEVARRFRAGNRTTGCDASRADRLGPGRGSAAHSGSRFQPPPDQTCRPRQPARIAGPPAITGEFLQGRLRRFFGVFFGKRPCVRSGVCSFWPPEYHFLTDVGEHLSGRAV